MIVSIEHMYRQARDRLYHGPNNNNNNSNLGSIDDILLPSRHQHARTTITASSGMANEDATRNGTTNSAEASTALSTSTGLYIESGLEEVATRDGLASSDGGI
jgi:hypothetical protein